MSTRSGSQTRRRDHVQVTTFDLPEWLRLTASAEHLGKSRPETIRVALALLDQQIAADELRAVERDLILAASGV